MTYYNTNAEPGPELTESRKRAQGQEDEVLAFFQRHPMSEYTRRHIEVYFHLPTPSATRSLRNLTRDGRLEKSEKTIRCAITGKSVHTWRLVRTRSPEQENLF